MNRPELPEIYILRHGETVWNVEGRMQGRFDSPLTALGRAQARAMGKRLARDGVTGPSHRWITSPQGRAAETTRLAIDPFVVFETDIRLAEIGMGTWAGLSRAEIDAGWPGPAEENMIGLYARIPDGESFDELTARCRAVLASLTGPTVIVTHGMTSRFLRMVALGLDFGDLATLPGGQGVIHRIRDGHATVLVPQDLRIDAANGNCAI